MERRGLTVAVLTALLCLASFAPRVAEAAIARPTETRLKAELGKLAESVAKRHRRYSNFTSTVNKYFGLASRLKYDLSALANATILIPINTESEALLKKLPLRGSNIPKFYRITAFHILRKKLYMPELKEMKPGQAVGTQLNQALYKRTPVNVPRVSFASSVTVRAVTWTTIITPRMYAGPYFVAHGVSRVLIPVGTKV